MSKIALSSPGTGTATYTISAPTGSTDRTVVLPDSNGTILTTATAGVPVNGPAFSASASATQTISVNTAAKAAFNLESFDTNSNYDTALYRFTPTVAGYYQFNATVLAQTTAANYGVHAVLYKNGSINTLGNTVPTSAYSYPYSTVSAVIYMNGSTDYVETYIGTFGPSGTMVCNGSTVSAALIRSAT